MDGASNFQGSKVGPILINLKEVVAKYALRFLFKETNNQAEYKALLVRLNIVKEFRVKGLRVLTNSQLIVG